MLADLIAEEIATPGKTSQHPFAVTRPMRPAPLDDAAIARAADGIVTSLLGGAALPAGRALELTALVQAILARELDPDAQHPDRAIVRLLERAPMEEALPLVFDLLTRRR